MPARSWRSEESPKKKEEVSEEEEASALSQRVAAEAADEADFQKKISALKGQRYTLDERGDIIVVKQHATPESLLVSRARDDDARNDLSSRI